MAKKIEIYENTLLKLLVRRGIDIDRKNVVLSEGELGYTTDTKKLYIGDGQTPGGILVQGNSILEPTNNILTFPSAIEGDVVYNTNDKTLYRFKGGEYDQISNWEAIGSTYSAGDGTITIINNTVKVGQISAGNIHSSALGGSLKLDSNGKITIDSSSFSTDTIAISTPNGFLSLPGKLKINTVEYIWPNTGSAGESYLKRDVAGNLSWVPLESTSTVLATTTGSLVPVGMIAPVASSTNIPSGWLLCNGQSVFQSAYGDLFDVIGTTYGGDEITFRVPNLINKTLYGVSNTPETSTVYQTGSSGSTALSATGTLYIIKAVADSVAAPTISFTSPLTCSVDGVDQTGVAISPYQGDIEIGIPPVPKIQGSSGYRNKAINGNFDFWQRATATVNSPVTAITRSRTADRWATYAAGVNNGLFSVTRQPCTQTELNFFNANYFQRLTYSNGVGSNNLISIADFFGPTTDVNIIVDSSGSMGVAEDTIRNAVQSGALKTRLLPFYGNNEALYNQRVQFFEAGERTFRTGTDGMLGRGSTRGGTRLINLVFQDEAEGGGYNHTNNTTYTADVTNLRSLLESYTPGYFVGVVFQVTGYPAFKEFLQKVDLGLAPFESLNLADKPEIGFKYDISKTSTQEQFVQIIEEALLAIPDIAFTSEGPPIYDVLDRGDSGVLGIQNFENAAEVLGKTMTLSFWARASQPTKIFSESQIHAMPGATSMWTPSINKVFDLSTTWQKFTHTYTMPTFQQVSAAAYNPNAFPNPVPEAPTYELLGPTNSLPPLSSWIYQIDIKTHWTKGTSIRHGNSPTRPGAAVNYPGEAMTQAELESICTSVLSSGAGGYYDIAQVQLEEGDMATDFEFRPQGIELGLCQRYYEIGGTTSPDPMGSRSRHHLCTVGANTHAGWQFSTTKCRVPAIRFWRPSLGRDVSLGTIENIGESNPINVLNITGNIHGVTYFNTDGNITSALHSGGLMEIGWEADAEI